MENKLTTQSLLERLTQADICCHDCGHKFGVYSVGVSSTWEAECPVCGKVGRCTETRDYGYLTKGINELKAQRTGAEPFSKLTKDFTPERKAKIKEQSKVAAAYMASVGPIMDDDELEGALSASYEVGELTLKLTADEVGFLNECLDTIQEYHCSLQFDAGETEDVALFESVEKKITDLYDENCENPELSPALKKFHELYGTYGTENDVERVKWEVFRDAFHAGLEHNKEAK